MLIFKAKQDKKPFHLHSQISTAFNVITRLALNNGIKETRRKRSTLGKQSFIPRAISQWNSLPWNIRSISTITEFKRKMTVWVKGNY